MKEGQLHRLEDMVTQLIGMVGNVVSEQKQMRSDMTRMQADMNQMQADMKQMQADMNARFDRLEDKLADTQRTDNYVLKKIAEHDRDIDILKQKLG